ncbi:Nramp family divalent metal transporter [Nanoarchaeota archaeon]
MRYLKRLGWKRIVFILGILGPGIIGALAGNEAGGIATYSIAGAHFEYNLLWTMIPVTILLLIIQEMVARMGAVTGKGLSDLIRENFGIKITFFIMIGLLIANLFITVAEFAGIASVAGIFGVDKTILVIGTAILVWLFVLKLNYKFLEKFFLFIGLFYLIYIVSGIMAGPDWGVVLEKTFIPSFEFSPLFIGLFLAIIGTTVTPWMQFYLQSSVVEKGIRKEDYKYTKWDVIIGAVLTDVIAFFIIISTAAIIFPQGVQIETATDAALALEPVLGNSATLLFAIAFFAAALFGAFLVPLSTSYYICEAFGWESGVNKKFKDAKVFYSLLTLIIIISAAIVLIPNLPLLTMILSSQVINGIILPMILIAILVIVNKKEIMGSYTNPPWLNFLAWLATIVIIISTFLLFGTYLL